MRMVSFFKFLTEMGIIIEEMFFSIIKGDNFVTESSFDCSIMNLGYCHSWSESDL